MGHRTIFHRRWARRFTAAAALAAVGVAAVPTPAAARPGAPIIRYDGEVSLGVFCVQQVLWKYTGWLTESERDWTYGPRTREGVIRLQRFYGLREDGIVGPETGEMIKFTWVWNQKPGDLDWYNLGYGLSCQEAVPTRT